MTYTLLLDISAPELVIDGPEDGTYSTEETVTVHGRVDVGSLLTINEVEVPLQESMTEQTMEQFKAKQLLLAPGARGQSNMQREAETPLNLLLAITAFVLLIACANVANLLLARGAQRGQEMAIRSSLGAARTQLLRQLMTESLLLAMLGGLASLLVAQGTLTLMNRLLPPDASQMMSFALDGSVIAFVFPGSNL